MIYRLSSIVYCSGCRKSKRYGITIIDRRYCSRCAASILLLPVGRSKVPAADMEYRPHVRGQIKFDERRERGRTPPRLPCDRCGKKYKTVLNHVTQKRYCDLCLEIIKRDRINRGIAGTVKGQGVMGSSDSTK